MNTIRALQFAAHIATGLLLVGLAIASAQAQMDAIPRAQRHRHQRCRQHPGPMDRGRL